MPILDDTALNDLVAALRRRVSAHYPEWTEQSTGDPGTSLVQLFAFLAESLLYRADEIPEHARQRFLRLAQLALTLPVEEEPSPPAPLERVRYSFGMVLGVDDFEAEQNYFRERMRRHNRELHGAGIVRGLGVSVEHDEGERAEHVVVGAGFAIAPDGEEIAVPERATHPLPGEGGACYVTIAYAEHPTRPVPALGDESGTAYTRIEEGFAISVAEKVQSGTLTLARLVQHDGRWRVDEAYEPVRVSHAGP
jgi:hypothetical protein